MAIHETCVAIIDTHTSSPLHNKSCFCQWDSVPPLKISCGHWMSQAIIVSIMIHDLMSTYSKFTIYWLLCTLSYIYIYINI